MTGRQEPYTRMSTLIDLSRVLRNTGLDAEPILAGAGVPPGRPMRPTDRVPLRVLTKAIELASERAGDPLLAVRLGLRISPRSLGAVGTLITLAPNLRAAIGSATRYLRLFNVGPSLSLSVDGPEATCTYRIPALDGCDARHYAEFAIAGCLAYIAEVVGKEWRPSGIRLPHDLRAPKPHYEALFGASVVARPGTRGPSILFPADALELVNQLSDIAGHAALERHLAEQLRLGSSSEDLILLLRQEISRALLVSDAPVTVASIAGTLGFSVRTLQRRLADHRTSFDELVDDVRREWAARYLEDQRLTISDTAYLLGYSEVSSFTRAFQRWTGESPSDYRRARAHAVA